MRSSASRRRSPSFHNKHGCAAPACPRSAWSILVSRVGLPSEQDMKRIAEFSRAEILSCKGYSSLQSGWVRQRGGTFRPSSEDSPSGRAGDSGSSKRAGTHCSLSSRNGDRELPRGPAAKTPCSQCRGTSSTPGWPAKILHASWRGQKKGNSQAPCHTLAVIQEAGKSPMWVWEFERREGPSCPAPRTGPERLRHRS